MPTKAEQKLIDAAVNGFNTQYASDENWGRERWHGSLLPALQLPTRHAALVNPFVPRHAFDGLIETSNVGPVEPLVLPRLPNDTEPRNGRLTAYIRTSGGDAAAVKGEVLFPQPVRVQVGPHSLLSHWNLDAASLLCAELLAVRPTDRILDLCAAPGGKALALAQLLFSDQAANRSPSPTPTRPSPVLHVNEIDPTRNRRLVANLKSYLPASLLSSASSRCAISVLQLDASTPHSHARLPLAGHYDRVLLDAPCSSERHLVHSHLRATSCGRLSDSELVKWRRGQSKAIARTQAGLLLTALRAVRVGGRVVYSTCSIERGENDGVVERVREMLVKLRKKGEADFAFECLLGRAGIHDAAPDPHRMRPVDAARRPEREERESVGAGDPLDDWSEPTEYGRIALPDHPAGGRWGPLFFCVMTKTSTTSTTTSTTTTQVRS